MALHLIPIPAPANQDTFADFISLSVGHEGSYLDQYLNGEWRSVAFLAPADMRKLATQLLVHADWLEAGEIA